MTKQELEALLHEIRDLPVDDFAVAGRVASITARISEEFDRLRAAVEPPAERVCADSADGNHVLKQDSPFSIVYCDACGMNKGFRGDER